MKPNGPARGYIWYLLIARDGTRSRFAASIFGIRWELQAFRFHDLFSPRWTLDRPGSTIENSRRDATPIIHRYGGCNIYRRVAATLCINISTSSSILGKLFRVNVRPSKIEIIFRIFVTFQSRIFIWYPDLSLSITEYVFIFFGI